MNISFPDPPTEKQCNLILRMHSGESPNKLDWNVILQLEMRGIAQKLSGEYVLTAAGEKIANNLAMIGLR